MIEVVAKHKQKDPNFKLESLLGAFDKVYTSQEVRYRCPNDRKKIVLDTLKNKVAENPDLFGSKIVEIVTLDGMRVIFKDGFALIRQSNTEPVFTLRFEAGNKEKCESYQNAMICALDECMSQA